LVAIAGNTTFLANCALLLPTVLEEEAPCQKEMKVPVTVPMAAPVACGREERGGRRI